MLPALYLVQEQQGYITGERDAARRRRSSGCTPADVEDVVTYYTMFFTKPVGKFVLQVCRTLSCALNGAERVTEEICGEARDQAGRDRRRRGMFTLIEVECLGACDRAPVIMVNDEHWHENGSARGRCAKLLDDLRRAARRRSPAAISTWKKRRRAGVAAREVRRGGSPSRRSTGGSESSQQRHMEPILTKYVSEPNCFTLDFYLQHRGLRGAEEGAGDDSQTRSSRS